MVVSDGDAMLYAATANRASSSDDDKEGNKLGHAFGMDRLHGKNISK